MPPLPQSATSLPAIARPVELDGADAGVAGLDDAVALHPAAAAVEGEAAFRACGYFAILDSDRRAAAEMDEALDIVGERQAAAVDDQAVEGDPVGLVGGQHVPVAGKDQPRGAGDAQQPGARRQDDIGDDIAAGRQEYGAVVNRRLLQQRLKETALVVGKVRRQAARPGVDRAAKGRRLGGIRRRRGKRRDGDGTGEKAASIHVGSLGSHILKDRAAKSVPERDVSQGRHDICMGEVVALEEQGFAGLLGECVDETVAKIQLRRVTPSAESQMSMPCRSAICSRLIERDDFKFGRHARSFSDAAIVPRRDCSCGPSTIVNSTRLTPDMRREAASFRSASR